MTEFLSKAGKLATRFASRANKIVGELAGILTSGPVVALYGLLLIATGVGQIYEPAGLIVAGVGLILAAADSRR